MTTNEAPSLRVLEAYHRGALPETSMILLALQRVGEEDAGEFLASLTGALSNSVRHSVDELPADDDDVAWKDVRILQIGMYDRDFVGDMQATQRERLRRGVRILRARFAHKEPVEGDLDKDRTIQKVIARLGLPARGWKVEDHWEADRMAIGVRSIANAANLVYVSTYFSLVDRFDFECEQASEESDIGYVVVNEGQNVTFDELLTAMRAHLDGSDR